MNYTAAATLSFELAQGEVLEPTALTLRLQQLFPDYPSQRLHDLATQLASGNLAEKLDDVLLFRGPSTDGMGGWRN